MLRDLSRLSGATYDVVVVGGGIHGACIAWDAVLRGLSVALVEREDFGGATSANSLRIVHGGLRYLARGDLPRMRESILERSALLRIAPSLVEPLPVLVPTAIKGTQSRLALGAAIVLNDLLSPDRNRGLAPGHRIPRGRLVALQECRTLFPAFPVTDSTGGALWYDARMRHPERLTLAFVRAAVKRGAAAANYCRMERTLDTGGEVRGVVVTDAIGGGTIDVKARTVVVAAGPWTEELVDAGRPQSPRAFGLNLVIGCRLADVAVGVRAPTGRAEDPIIGGNRFVFLAPQEATTLLGTWYAPAAGRRPDDLMQEGAAVLLKEFRAACPALAVTEADLLRTQWGWLPLKGTIEPGRPDALADRPRVIDHGANQGLKGMFSVAGVKYTTARRVAERVVDRIVARLGAVADRCRTAEVPIDEGEGRMPPSLEARVRLAVREEMAIRLADVVLRRVGSGGPSDANSDMIVTAAQIAGTELGWTSAQREREIEDVMRQLRATRSRVEPAA